MTSIPVGTCRTSRGILKRHFIKKENIFFVFFIAFLKVAWNLEYFEKKDQYLSLIISKIINSERCGYLNV